MRLTRVPLLATLALLAAGVSLAQSSPLGSFALTTRHDQSGGTTDTALRVRSDGDQRIKVDRTARYTDASHANQAPFRWYGTGVQLSAEWLRVDYRITASGGISSTLTPNDHRVRGYYLVQGDRIREVLINQTPTGALSGWTRAGSRGTRDDAFVLAARSKARSLHNAIMNWRTDVVDYYGPGDQDHYTADVRELSFFLDRALWAEVPALPNRPAFKTLQAINADRGEIVSPGRALVLLDANADVLAAVYEDETGELFDGQGPVSPTVPVTPAPPSPPVVVNCPLGGAPVAQLQQAAAAQSTRLTGFIMEFRTDIADYYGPGDQAYYDADTQAAEAYFGAATWAEVAIPAGYTAYKALKATAPDPTDVVLGSVTLLFDCSGNVIEVVYDHEGETYDTSDM